MILEAITESVIVVMVIIMSRPLHFYSAVMFVISNIVRFLIIIYGKYVSYYIFVIFCIFD